MALSPSLHAALGWAAQQARNDRRQRRDQPGEANGGKVVGTQWRTVGQKLADIDPRAEPCPRQSEVPQVAHKGGPGREGKFRACPADMLQDRCGDNEARRSQRSGHRE